MYVIRSMVVFAFIVLAVAVIGIPLLLASLFLKDDKLWWWFAVPFLRSTMWMVHHVGGVVPRISGAENLPGKDDMRRVVLCSKHQSTWETFFLPSMTPHALAYVFKRELLTIPVFGWSMARLGMVPIDRGRRTAAWNKVAEEGRVLMDRGKWIIMFPEGTRTERGSKGSYKTGGTRLAVATGAYVIPIAVTSGRCWPRRSFWFMPGIVDLSIGEPITSDGRQPDELMEQIEDWIEGEMRRLDPEAYA